MRFLIIFCWSKVCFFGTVLEHFTQRNFKIFHIFRRRPTIVTTIFTEPPPPPPPIGYLTGFMVYFYVGVYHAIKRSVFN